MSVGHIGMLCELFLGPFFLPTQIPQSFSKFDPDILFHSLSLSLDNLFNHDLQGVFNVDIF